MCGHHIAAGETLDKVHPADAMREFIEHGEGSAAPRRDANGDLIPWAKEHDYFMAFDPENPDVPTD